MQIETVSHMLKTQYRYTGHVIDSPDWQGAFSNSHGTQTVNLDSIMSLNCLTVAGTGY